MMKSKQPWVYGQSHTPTNWHEAADILKSSQPKPKRKSSGLLDRLANIEQQLKDRK